LISFKKKAPLKKISDAMFKDFKSQEILDIVLKL